ncbi:hypothetical protein PDK45_30030, partial [Bacillus cereus]|nr:hypothetical protein [Bacillus cereus]
VTSMHTFPITVVDDGAMQAIAAVFREHFGAERVVESPSPLAGSEDVGIFGTTAGVPTAFWFWGGYEQQRFEDAAAATIGFGGAILVAIGGLGAGSTRQHDPLLESAGLSWLRFGHGLVVSSICMWLGVVLMLLAWLGLGRHVIAGKVTKESLLIVIPCWLLPLLASVPVFSRDA